RTASPARPPRLLSPRATTARRAWSPSTTTRAAIQPPRTKVKPAARPPTTAAASARRSTARRADVRVTRTVTGSRRKNGAPSSPRKELFASSVFTFRMEPVADPVARDDAREDDLGAMPSLTKPFAVFGAAAGLFAILGIGAFRDAAREVSP